VNISKADVRKHREGEQNNPKMTIYTATGVKYFPDEDDNHKRKKKRKKNLPLQQPKEMAKKIRRARNQRTKKISLRNVE
jgi:hypothetical protein